LKKTVFKDYFVSVIGVALTAVGLVSFLMPNNIAAGGANGIAIVIKGQGAYSKKEKDFIYVTVNKRQKHEVIKNIKKIDPYAFVIVQETSDVVGYGFGTLKNY